MTACRDSFVKCFVRCLPFWMAGMVFASILLSPPQKAWAEKSHPSWSVFAYGGQWTANRIGEILQAQTKFRSSYVWAVGASRTVYEIGDFLLLEFEVNTARHTGRQNHSEVNAAFALRWHRFPWDQYVNTSLAYGLGPSYAFRRPPIEQRSNHDPDPSRLLVFMPVEVTFGPPEKYQIPLEVLLRVHHRSGAFGVVSDARGSNFITSGLRFRF